MTTIHAGATGSRTRLLGRMLVDAAVIDEAMLQTALEAQRRSRERLGEVLVRLGVEPQSVYRTLSDQLRLPLAAMPLRPQADAIGVLDHALAQRHRALALQVDPRVLQVAMADPLDLAALDELQFQTGRRVRPLVAVPTEIDAAIAEAYVDGRVSDQLDRMDDRARAANAGARKKNDGEPEEVIALRRASEAAPIVAIVNVLLERAVGMGASDLHMEPVDNSFRCRARVDGYLREMQSLPSRVAGAVVSRIKVMAGLDIATRRRPQDGRASLRVGDRELSIRVSTLPTVAGEKVVVRVLDPENAQRGLDRLGMPLHVRDALAHMLARRHGALLVTGPTGSGKTTSLYAMLGSLDRERLNIVTLEDPVEYRIAGLTQVQVHVRAGLGFPAALRSVLRQDPDVIMVGEMRDRETVEVGMAAALTGHLVLSTLHTIDAASAVARLLEMGAPPYLVAGGLIGVLAQRVVRRRCESCAGTGGSPSQPCGRCGGEGMRGRIGVFELMPMNDDIARLILRRESAPTLREAAAAAGMVSILDDARAKLREGLTSEEEVAPLAIA